MMKRNLVPIIFMAMTSSFMSSCSSDDALYRTAAQPLFEMSATTVERDATVSFTDQSVPLSGTELTGWKWNFDFGNADNKTEFSEEQNPTYAYKAIGTYTVRLTVIDSQKRTASVSKNITVVTPYKELAHASFKMPGTKLSMNAPIQFTDTSIPADGATITKWAWSFGESEESVSTVQNPTWTYTKSGNYTVSLTVTDSKNNVSTATQDLIVIDPADMVSIKWKTALLGAIENTVSPAMSPDGKTVFMWADQSATNAYDVALKAYDVATGNQKWSFNVNDEFASILSGAGVRLVYSSPSVGSNGDIYVCARDLKHSGAARKSYLLAIKSDGTKDWHYAFGIDANFNYLTPAVDASGKVYVGHLTNQPFEIGVLDPSTGAKTSSIPLSVGVRSGISLDKSGNIYFCSTGSNGIYSFTSAGVQNWVYNTDISTTGGDITIGANGTIYTVAAGASNGLIVAVSSSGTKLWEYPTPDGIQFGGVVLAADGTVYANGGNAIVGVESAGVYALNADGTLKWHFATTEDVNNCVPLVDNRGYVHFITDKGTYYVVTNTGTLYGKKSLGAKSYASPVMNSSGTVCVGVEDENSKSYVYCLDTGASSYASSAWPMKGQNPQRTHLQK
jgi:PKD repeat protein